jgi:putative restriction endonuclease
MRYWWVNQNQTYRHEIDGDYIWSPKRKKNQHRNPFYEFMREVSPGDIVFSFFDTRIAALGIANSFCDEFPKPTEFGPVGANWSAIGWKVDVRFRELQNRIHPKSHIGRLRPLLPREYSPLMPDGNGKQSVYLAEVGRPLAQELFNLIGPEASQVVDVARAVGRAERAAPGTLPTIEELERGIESRILKDVEIADTERDALVKARRGQGRFREAVRSIERACRVTKVDRMEHLIASHIKPWRDCSNDERLDGENGFLLTPTVDHLFDKGFISFERDGRLIISPVADPPSLAKMGVRPEAKLNVGTFSEGQRKFLVYHRDSLLKKAQKSKPRPSSEQS